MVIDFLAKWSVLQRFVFFTSGIALLLLELTKAKVRVEGGRIALGVATLIPLSATRTEADCVPISETTWLRDMHAIAPTAPPNCVDFNSSIRLPPVAWATPPIKYGIGFTSIGLTKTFTRFK